MVIGIDGNEANVGRRVGIGEYAFELFTQFYSLRKSGQISSQFVIYLKTDPLSDMPQPTAWWKYKIVKPRKFWTQIGLPLYLFTHFPRPDVFFTPSHYAPRFSPVPTAISIMDMAFIHFPHLFNKHDLYQLVHWTKYSAKNASAVFTISNASKNDILSEYHVQEKKVVVTYLGIKPFVKTQPMSADLLEKKYHINYPYLLFVGTLQPRKNISRIIEALSLITDKNVNLLIVGKKGWLYESILQAPEKFGVKERVHFLDFVPDEDLPVLYKNAECFVWPSLYEGFGLPVLEAMKYECPVITSNVSSLPEAGGDAAMYVDPESSEDIAKAIEKVLSDSKLRESMKKKGLEHIKKFSWENTAKKTIEVLEALVNER